MIVSVDIKSKKLGNKELLRDLSLNLQDNEKVAVIGRNGVGKTTFFRVLSGQDKLYAGNIDFRRGVVVVATEQEHNVPAHVTPIEYVLENLPEYAPLKHILDTYPDTMGDDMAKIHVYSEALDRFNSLGYYQVEEEVVATLGDYGLNRDLVYGSFSTLSGGQKRFVELAKVTHSKAHLALIDEPTNHMDYVAKERFIEWFRTAKESVCVISHDRDVLREVDRIIEIKEMRAVSYPGNYDEYLKQNSVSTITAMAQYEVAQRTLEKLREQIQQAKAKKAGSSKTPNPFIILERRLQKEYDALEATMVKPSFWIDADSIEQLQDKVADRYDKYKAKNIRIAADKGTGHYKQLMEFKMLSLGYDKPLFDGLNAQIHFGDRLQIRGRNGAGKTTLVRSILAEAGLGSTQAKVLGGQIIIDKNTKIGIYEQEIHHKYLEMPLGQAITDVYRAAEMTINDQTVRKLLSQYLFDPQADYNLKIDLLSGGQKARFQLIAMLAGNPNLLIVDEPTNHLDLPSIEELEKALTSFGGAIIYISHDSYFTDKLAGQTVQIGAL